MLGSNNVSATRKNSYLCLPRSCAVLPISQLDFVVHIGPAHSFRANRDGKIAVGVGALEIRFAVGNVDADRLY
jgi:hypothetical protein